jgi:uncharacterized protein
VAGPLALSRRDVRRALVGYSLSRGTLDEVFARLGSVQYDPLSPAGCNHDLVLQARVPGYRVGAWQAHAYRRRRVYDGWDKQASLIPYEGWRARRVICTWQSRWLDSIVRDHPGAVEAVLGELEAHGPMAPRDFEFQQQRPEWKGSWYGSSLTKQTLRALWHAGRIMTHSRRNGQHVYDLTERVVPPDVLAQPPLDRESSLREILRDRHRGMGLIRPTAPYEVWAMDDKRAGYRAVRDAMVADGELVPVEVEGVKALAAPELLEALGSKPPARVTFLAPLDQLLWDRKMTAHLFGFAYKWEVYVPEAKREHGYYVLPVLHGDRFLGRIEFAARQGVLEVKGWWPEADRLPRAAMRAALDRFRRYVGADEVVHADGVPRFAA